MTTTRSIPGRLLHMVAAGLAVGLILSVATPARAGGYYGGHGYGGHRYGYGGYRSGYYGRSYGYGGHGYGYSGHGGHSHHHGLIYGLLSIPRAVVRGLFGYPHHGGGHDGGHGGADGRGDDTGVYGGGPASPQGAGVYGGSSANPRGAASNGGTSGSNTSASLDGGWAWLAVGRYEKALWAFGSEASRYPAQGAPKVGYALSAAAGGDLGRGVWAMRRALRIDPDSLHYLTIDGRLRAHIEPLVARYYEYSAGAPESAFMRASLHYLLGDSDTARGELDLALAKGDHTSSTANLARLIDGDPSSRGSDDGAADSAPPATGTY